MHDPRSVPAMRPNPEPNRLVLAGVGHANLEVLRRLSRPARQRVAAPIAGSSDSSGSSAAASAYTVPALPDTRVDLTVHRRVVKVAPASKAAATTAAATAAAGSTDPFSGGPEAARELPYDFVVFAVGSEAAGAATAMAGGGAVLSCKPIGRVVELRRRLEDMAGRPRSPAAPATVAVVGGGAAGVEIALAIAGRLSGQRVVLVEAGPTILASSPPRLCRRAEQVLERHGVELRTGSKVVEVKPLEPMTIRDALSPAGAADGAGGAVLLLGSGEQIACTLAVWATAAVGWPFFREAGLPLDGRGFLLIDDSLRSVADPRVFAAGDCGTLAAYPGTAKAGVYAVREGPVLFRGLRAALTGGQPPHYRPQRGFLAILNTGDGRALLSYKGFVSYSRWAFRLKDWIDRRFLARYREVAWSRQERRDGSSGGI